MVRQSELEQRESLGRGLIEVEFEGTLWDWDASRLGIRGRPDDTRSLNHGRIKEREGQMKLRTANHSARSLRCLVSAVTAILATPALALPAVLPQEPQGSGGRPEAAREVTGPAAVKGRFEAIDFFQMEWASEPQISPDGTRIVYARNFFDIMTDRSRSNLWTVNVDGTGHRTLTAGNARHSSPRWSPDGSRLLYVAEDEQGKRQLWARWMDSGQTAKITSLDHPPRGISWSPAGDWIAFTSFSPAMRELFAKMPEAPEGAQWAKPARVIESLNYRADGQGYLEEGYQQVFVVPAEGNTPRQLTSGPYNHHGTPAWTPDGRYLIVSANRHEGWEHDANNTEIYEVNVADGSVRALTDRHGPDRDPVVSPDGSKIAYLGFDDRYQGYQVIHLYVMNRNGSGQQLLTGELDRSVQAPVWSGDGRGLFVQYADRGNTKLAFVSLDEEVLVLAEDVGGVNLGRPYPRGSFTVAPDGRFAYTHSRPHHPADVAIGSLRAGPEQNGRRLTRLNDDLLADKELGEVEEIWYTSSVDGRQIQGWIVKPPGFDPSSKYPLILEIHGGPFANYGDRFSAEFQLYAAAGYVVLYTNPRGSTSYGEAFGNLIHHAYPGEDYHDLMAGVDELIDRGYVDPQQLFVTGGSGGGVLTSWIVGHTERFRAAAVEKPVINWYSWALTTDMYVRGVNYWFPGMPWEHRDHYMDRSPISYVGNVTTPTMLITGEEDYRTPMADSEQFYQALKLQKIPTALVRIPGASHSIAARPSNAINKVVHILGWFDRWRVPSEARAR